MRYRSKGLGVEYHNFISLMDLCTTSFFIYYQASNPDNFFSFSLLELINLNANVRVKVLKMLYMLYSCQSIIISLSGGGGPVKSIP